MSKNYNSFGLDRDVFLKKQNSTPSGTDFKGSTMRRLSGFLLLYCILFAGFSANAQVTVTGCTGTGNGSYATLSAAATAIVAAQPSAVILVEITGNTTEPAAGAAFVAGTWTSLTIQPSGGSWTISGAATAGSPLISFNGSDNVTINGLNSGGNALTITNTTASATSGTSTIRFQTDATNNTITNCTILGSSSSATGTAGGNIFFASGAVSTGNDGNTISNCNLGPAGANLPSKLIYFSGTSNTDPGTANSGIVINNNNFYDYFSATTSSAAIDLNSGSSSVTISNNKFYQTATRTQTTGAAHRAININNGSGNNFSVTGNTIGFANASGTGTYNFVGVSSSVFIPINVLPGTTTVSTVQNNTIAGIAFSGAISGTGTSGPFRAIYVTGLTNVNNNIIGSMGATGSISVTSSTTSAGNYYGIYNNSSSNTTISNNQIGGISITNSSTGTATFTGIFVNTSTSATATLSLNTIGGTIANSLSVASSGTSSQIVGINIGLPAATLTSNIIRNLTNNNGTGTTTSASVIGLLVGATSANHTVSQNSIYNLSNTNVTTANVVTGIQFTGSTANVVERNTIYGLTTATNSTSAEINGIRVAGGTTVYRNNMIALGAGVANALGGVASNGGTTGINGFNGALGTDSFWHNTIYIGGTATAGTGASYAFNGTQTTNTRSFRNNIFVNDRTNSGATGKHYAVKINGSTANPTGLTINNNVYYGTGSGFTFGYFNSADVASLAAWKTAVGQDAGSYNANPQLLDPTNATPDLHINPSVSSSAEGNGVDVGVTLDFDGQTRSGLTPVDIGADAGNFIGGDLTPPAITYTALTNTTSTANRLFNNITITDATGVNVTVGTKPRLYYKKSTETNDVSGWKFVEASGSTSPFDFTIDYSVLTGGAAAFGDVIQYFVVAQDTGLPTVAINSGNFAAIPTSVALTSAQFPIGGSINSYTILNSLGGTKTVCPSGCDYATLTLAGGAFDAINNALVISNLTLEIAGDLTAETGAIKLNEFATPFTVTIKPAGGSRTISGTSAGSLLGFNGADNVLIDGSLSSTANTICPASSASRDLTITNNNTGTSSAVVWFQSNATNGATNNTVRNCTIVGNANTTTLVGLGFGSSTISTTSLGIGNNNNTVENNSVSKVQNAIYSQGTSAGNKNTGNKFNLNQVTAAVGTDNPKTGITLGFENNVEVSGNRLLNLSSATDNWGISLGITTSSGFSTTITGNEVTNAIVTKNTIGALAQTSSNSGAGIVQAVLSTAGVTNLIANNIIYDVNVYCTSPDIGAGILIGGGTGTTNVYHNSVSLTGTRNTSTTFPTYAIAIGGTNPVVDVRNNILINTQTTTNTGKSYAIGLAYSSYANLVSNNNLLFTNGTSAFFAQTGGLGTSGTDRTSLSSWTTTTGKDTVSKNTAIVFTGSPSVLSIDQNNATNILSLEGSGATGTGITDDFECQLRNASTPDIGADEFTPPSCSGTNPGTAVGNTVLCGSGTPTITASGFDSGSGISYQWYSSGIISDYTNDTGLIVSGQTNPATLTTGVVSSTTYYWLKVTCSATSSSSNSNMITVTVNPKPTATASSNTPVCSGSVLNLNGTTDIGTTFTWTGPNSFTSSSQNPSISTVTTAAAGTYNFTATANGCSSTVATTVVAINATPVAPTTTGYNICLNASIPNGQGLTSTSVGAGTITGSQTLSFNVAAQPTEINSSPGNTVASATMTALPVGAIVTSVVLSYPGLVALTDSWRADISLGLSGALVNAAATDPTAANSAGTFNYTRTATTGITATNTGGTVNLLYWDSVDDNFGAEATFPTGTAVATVVVNYSIPNPASIQWYTTQTSGTAIGSGSPFNPIGVDPALPDSSVSGNYTYYAEVQNGSCPSTRTAAVLSIGATLTASATAAPNTSVCAGTTVTLSSAFTGGGGGIAYSWKVGATEVNTTASFSVTPSTTTTYDLTITDACSQIATASVTVTVNPLPATVVVSGAGTFCSNATITADNGGDGTIYFQGTTNNGTSTATASASQVVSVSGTYYFRAQSAAGCWGAQGSAVVVIQTPVTISTTPATICQGGASVALAASATCPTVYVNSNTFSMTDIPASGAPTYVRSSGGTVYSSSSTVAFSTQVFRPTVTGSYVINGCGSGDTHMQLYTSPFNPSSPTTNFLEANDDGNGSTCTADPRITRTLTAGVDYVLVYTPFSNGSAVTGITITVTPPVGGNVQTPTGAGVLNWYADTTSSTVLGTGNSFDPVASGVLANTNTPGTTVYYVACSASSACRTPVNFVITPSVVPTLSFVTDTPGEFCAGTNVTFTATAGNLGGGTATYDFSIEGTSIQSGVQNTFSTTALADGEEVSVVVTITGGTCVSPSTLTGSMFVTVNDNFTVTASASANGSISPNGITTLTCEGTGDQTYTITPNAGYLVGDVLVDGVSQGAISSYTFTDVVTNHTISASFVVACTPTAPTVSLSSSDLDNTFAYGTSVTFTATAGNLGGGTASYDFKINGTSVQNGASNSYVVNNLANGNQVSVSITVAGGSCLSTTTADSNVITNTVTGAYLSNITNYCGQTLPVIGTRIKCSVPVGVVGVLGYRFKITNNVTNAFTTVDTSVASFNMTMASGFSYGT
ncbi:beta strand repeat-containing protein, partial [Flavobacterium buctense]